MGKKDESTEKKSASRGRIMQVVEVEEETPQKTGDHPASTNVVQSQPEEQPDIAGAFPMDSREPKEESKDSDEDKQEEIAPLPKEEKRDIVSELFETKETHTQYPEISLDKKPKKFGFLLWVLILLAIVGVIGGGLLFLKNRSSSQESVTSAVETPTPTLEPTPTETPVASISGKPKETPTKNASPSSTPKKTGLSIQVLNGSGEKGVASAAKKFLEDKGYNVVSTGNADNFDYEKTEIIIKSSQASSLEKLKDDLSEDYTVGSTSETLEPNAAYDAQVIIGKE